jgi:hypothetical protein
MAQVPGHRLRIEVQGDGIDSLGPQCLRRGRRANHSQYAPRGLHPARESAPHVAATDDEAGSIHWQRIREQVVMTGKIEAFVAS